MTHNTRHIPLNRLTYPTFVAYGGKVYRAWKPMRLAQPMDGTILVATDTSGRNQVALLYASAAATAEVIIG